MTLEAKISSGDHGRIDNKKFIVNKAAYDKVILPPGLEKPRQEYTYVLLQEFAGNGGEVIQLEKELKYINGDPFAFDELQQLNSWQLVQEITPAVMKDLSTNSRIRFENPEATEGKIFHMRREFDDGQLLFVSNFDKDIAMPRFNLEMEGRSVMELNLIEGKIEPYIFERNSSQVQFKVMLPPSGSTLLFIST
jgi:hypothetical protein